MFEEAENEQVYGDLIMFYKMTGSRSRWKWKLDRDKKNMSKLLKMTRKMLEEAEIKQASRAIFHKMEEAEVNEDDNWIEIIHLHIKITKSKLIETVSGQINDCGVYKTVWRGKCWSLISYWMVRSWGRRRRQCKLTWDIYCNFNKKESVEIEIHEKVLGERIKQVHVLIYYGHWMYWRSLWRYRKLIM